jgi:lactate racemase
MYSVPYSRGTLEFEIPAGARITEIHSKNLPPIADPARAVSDALARPVQSEPLSKLAKPGNKVTIVFTDSTRACPDYILVPAILHELEIAGVRDEDITLLCAIGLHRPSTTEERAAKLGQAVVDRYRVIDSAPRDPKRVVDLGVSPHGVRMSVCRDAYEADLLIATGVVEPHQYAGYSGGRKTVAIGAAGEQTIEYTHGPQMLDHPGTRLGRLEGNPFHEAVTESAMRAGLRFILNVVLDDDKHVVAVRAGEPTAALNELVGIARGMFEVSIPHQFDVAIGGVGYPKDSNLYQASRGASYLFFAPTPVVRTGGYLVIPARAEEGAGEGVGEQRFLEAMRAAPSMQAILDDARAHGYKPGAQRAFIMAKVLEAAKVIIVGSECPDIVRDLHMIPAADMTAAFTIIQQDLGKNLDVLLVPHALLTLPVVKS